MTYDPGRPLMTAGELRQHHVTRKSRNYTFSDCGEDDINLANRDGWKTLYAWGEDGWDLGDYPYVTLHYQQLRDVHALMSICEGDHDLYIFNSQQDAYAAVDYLFLWYGAGSGWAKRVDGFPLTWEQKDDLDNGLIHVDKKWRGPYRTDKG